MEELIRIHVLEHDFLDDQIVAQLLTHDAADQHSECPTFLRATPEVRSDSNQCIVLSADCVNKTSLQGTLEALRNFCASRPLILLIGVSRTLGRSAFELSAIVLGSRRRSLRSAALATPRNSQDNTWWSQCLLSAFESKSWPIVFSDLDGWITCANIDACRALHAGFEEPIGTLIDAQCDQFHRSSQAPHRLVHFDPYTGWPTPVHLRDLAACPGLRPQTARGAAPFAAVAFQSDWNANEAAISLQKFRDWIAGNRPVIPVREDGSPISAAKLLRDSRSHFRRPRRPRTDTHRPQAHQSPEFSGRLDQELADALSRDALSVQYQPQYMLATGHGCGVEALARWVLENGKMVAPAVFIPIAERSGMIARLGAWVLKSACEAAVCWRSGFEYSSLAVNVSALQIDETFCAVIARTLKQTGFPANKLELEITESAFIENPARTIEYLKEWKRLGVQIAMDDFGTGYSSLSRLAMLPVDRLKLDKSLTAMTTIDAKTRAVTRSIVMLAAELDINVIAEGVETEEQFQLLTDLGCPQGQGYLLGRPMSPKRARVALGKRWGNRPLRRHPRISLGECHVQ